jgi:hypothetical protein
LAKLSLAHSLFFLIRNEKFIGFFGENAVLFSFIVGRPLLPHLEACFIRKLPALSLVNSAGSRGFLCIRKRFF